MKHQNFGCFSFLFNNLNTISVNLSLLLYNERKDISLGYVRSCGLIQHMAAGPGIIILANMDTFWTLLLTLLSATATSAVMWQQEKKDGKVIKFVPTQAEKNFLTKASWLGLEMKWHFSMRWPVYMCIGALSQITCPRCNSRVCEVVYHQVTIGNRWAVSVPVCLLNCLTDKKPSSETATNVLPHFMVRTEHIFSKGLRKYAIILNHSQENHKPLNKCLFRYGTQKCTPVDPH